MAEHEEWRPVVGHEGLYEVSSLGRVRSIDRVIHCLNRHGQWAPRRYRGQLLRLRQNKDTGYHSVALGRRGGKEHRYDVHTLVAAAFLGAGPPGHEVCHNDGDPTHNRVANLRYDTRSANHRDTVRHGRNELANRVCCKRGHLLEAPNLRPSDLRKGHRACLACCRAGNTAYSFRKAGQPFDFQAEADRRYSLIMAGAVR